jgi:hypothetical protein
MEKFETRRGFLGGVLGVGAVAAAALVACASPEKGSTSLGPDGVTEILPAPVGNPYGNVMPDHVAAVRQIPSSAIVGDLSTSKRFE